MSERRAPPKRRSRSAPKRSASKGRAAPAKKRASRDSTTRRRRRTVIEQRGHGRLIAGATVCGLMFAGGIVLGERHKNKPVSAVVPDTATALLASADAAADEYAAMKDKLKLTFHNELTRIKESASIPVVSAVKAGAVKAGAVKTGAVKTGAVKTPAPKHVAKASAKPPEAKPKAVPVAGPKVDAKKPLALVPPQKTAAPPAAPSSTTDDDLPPPTHVSAKGTGAATDLRALIASRTDAAAPKKGARARAPAASTDVAHYVQVASLPSRERADVLIAKLRTHGVSARAVAVTLDSGNEVFRIVSANESSRVRAEALRDRIKSATGLAGLVRKAR